MVAPVSGMQATFEHMPLAGTCGDGLAGFGGPPGRLLLLRVGGWPRVGGFLWTSRAGAFASGGWLASGWMRWMR